MVVGILTGIAFTHLTPEPTGEVFMPQPSAVRYEPEECAWCMGRGREREEKCRACKGRGAVLAAQPARPCRSCAGTGRVGLIEERRACPSCGGGWDGALGREREEADAAASRTAAVSGSGAPRRARRCFYPSRGAGPESDRVKPRRAT